MNNLKKEVQKWIKHYQNNFSLQEWHIDVKYMNKQIPDTVENNEAAISSMPEYIKAFLEIRLDLIRKKEIRRIVKHELLHLFHADYDKLLVDILNNFDTDILPESTGNVYMKIRQNVVERLVTRLERIIK